MQAATLHTLYEAHARDVFRFARFLTGSEDAAADITSETFLRAWAGRDAVRVETAKAYLLAIARNLCRDRGRSAQRWRAAPMPDRAVVVLERRRRVVDGIRDHGPANPKSGPVKWLSPEHLSQRSVSDRHAIELAPTWMRFPEVPAQEHGPVHALVRGVADEHVLTLKPRR
jgi:RNA polymerase sigma factor (sigma-70 family)